MTVPRCTTRNGKHEWRLIDGPRLYENGTLLAWRFYCVYCLVVTHKEET